jgi:molybdenum cofactor cytidylyltransferase
MAELAAIILAAGYGSRMGRFKPLLPLGGKSAIEWAVAAFTDAGIRSIRVVTGYGAAELEPELKHLGVVGVRNQNYDRGMYSSIQVGIAALPDSVDACFLLPVDTPLVRASTVAALAARHAEAPAPVIHPSFRGQRGHPPLIGRELFAEIVAGDGDGGLRALLPRHAAAEVAVADEAILLDMDTPDEHLRLAELARQRHLPSAAECEAILELHGVAEPIRRHCRAVAAVATTLADHLDNVEPQLVAAAALLHDIAKGQPNHADAGAALVMRLGYPEVAEAIRRHMDFDFGDGPPDAAAVVFIADKLVREDRLVALENRFQPAFERFADQPEALASARRKYLNARNVLEAVEACAGMEHAQLLAHCGVAQ